MKKSYIMILPILICLLAGCSSEGDPAEGSTGDTAASASEAEAVGFRIFYHGFLITGPGENTEPAPVQTCMIGTQEEYDDFFSKYGLSSIYQLDTVDFEKECLVYCGRQSAQLLRGWSAKVRELHVSDAGIELIWDETVNYNAENADEAVAYQIIGASDCDVREVFFLKVQKEDIPEAP